MINSLTGFNPKNSTSCDREKLEKYKENIKDILITIVKRSNSRVLSGLARDSLLELLSRNVGMNALEYGLQVLEGGCLSNLLEIASELEDLSYESSMAVTRNTRSLVSIALERVYECMDHDKARDSFRDQTMAFIQDKLRTGDADDRVRVMAVIITLLQGPSDVGNACISQKGIVEMMLIMAGDESSLVQQRVAAEAIIAAANKKDKCTSIASLGFEVLKKLYKSSDEGIRVRALVGLCKIGSVGGSDASFKVFSESAMHSLVKACKKILINPGKDRDLKKWASEGLVYLTLDADIKEELISDTETIGALINLARTGDLSMLYGILTTFVNLTNSYDKREIMPELKELAAFAKQHVPQDHPKDGVSYVKERVKKLAEMNVTPALVALSKTESMSSREMIARVFNAICEQQELRGKVVQGGGVKVLLDLAKSTNTRRGRVIASQALARIGITMDPKIAFPNQRAIEVIKPLKNLLEIECSALENFEAMMALTNLAQLDESTQRAILRDNGFSKIEHYHYDDHPMLKRAATQCIANIITNPEVVKIFEAENDRLKFLFLQTQDEDLPTILAAAGAVAMITSLSVKCCEKILSFPNWLEVMMILCASGEQDIQHRGIFIAKNIIFASKDLAEKIIETKLFELLVAITRPEVDNISETVKKIANEILSKATDYGLIKNVQNK